MYKSLYCLLIWIGVVSCVQPQDAYIDRYALVNRHNVVLSTIDNLNSLTVGNGDFAFTADITGLQSFPDYYLNGIPLGTLSNWGWHSYPNVDGYSHGQVVRKFDVLGREVGYYHDFSEEITSERAKASGWLRENPHRMNLGLIGLKIYDENNQLQGIEDIENPVQKLNLWKGEIESHFEVKGVPVKVITICHPEKDMVAISIHSELIKKRKLIVQLQFPEADPGWKNTSLWGESLNHESLIMDSDGHYSIIEHKQDSTRYLVYFSYSSGDVVESDKHKFLLVPSDKSDSISFSCEFEERVEKSDTAPAFEFIRDIANSYWEKFWSEGGAVDFSDCSDKRSFELERRVVLSRYLTQVQCS